MTEHPQKGKLIGWVKYGTPFTRPPRGVIAAELVRQSETGAWVLTHEGAEIAGEIMTASDLRGG